ncbi:MAG: hypothetical protein J6Q51_04460 [Clostridia bacterium]|nr:hypothetical protein [Clostridia bacterium]
MIRLETVDINKTARTEELLAYIICKDYIFEDKECKIGDSSFPNSPDIYATDLSVGAEVVVCENYDTLKRIEKYFQGNIETKEPIVRDKKKLTPFVLPNWVTEYKQYITDKDEYMQNLTTVLFDKLTNQQNNQYRACKNVNLIIMSCFADKKYISPKMILNTVKEYAELFENRYNSIYFVLGNYLLCVDKNLNCKVLSDTTLKKYHRENDCREL